MNSLTAQGLECIPFCLNLNLNTICDSYQISDLMQPQGWDSLYGGCLGD